MPYLRVDRPDAEPRELDKITHDKASGRCSSTRDRGITFFCHVPLDFLPNALYVAKSLSQRKLPPRGGVNTQFYNRTEDRKFGKFSNLYHRVGKLGVGHSPAGFAGWNRNLSYLPLARAAGVAETIGGGLLALGFTDLERNLDGLSLFIASK